MNQNSLISELYYHQRQDEILKEIAAYHLANEAVNTKGNHTSEKSKILVWLGRQLQYMGFALEEHHGIQFNVSNNPYPETRQGDCA